MSLQVWINGELLAKEDAKISVFDHGLLYGDGVFEGLAATAAKSFDFASISNGCGTRPRQSGWRFPSHTTPWRLGLSRRSPPMASRMVIFV